MRAFVLAPLLVLALIAGCARPQVSAEPPSDAPRAPSAGPGAPRAAPTPITPVAVAGPGIPGRTKPAPPKSAPLPPDRVDAAPRSAPRIATACSSNADCVVRNVGSCCGAMPACVNKDAAVDPEAVKAECARRGMASTCGFKDIQSCSCVAGTCQDAGGSAPVSDR